MGPDYRHIGLKVGLEVHQQLDTETKLFCQCPTELFKGKPTITFVRRLRPTQSELGQIDPAAFFEFQKGVEILYEANNETACLVEMDEEPPHDLNWLALEAVLQMSLMLDAEPVDEIHVMRKTVIDGSNTTGFQRTCVVAFNGTVQAGDKPIPIELVGLEEDAARKGDETGNGLRYRIDRLGIPLVEVTTAPVIHTPQEAGEVALAVGRVLRATGKVKRGLGTIRQDLNISTRKGALVEIKGVQELELVSLVVENEVQRQLKLLEIREELTKRNVGEDDLQDEPVDVTHVFAKTECKVISAAAAKRRGVLAVKLRNFRGLLKRELTPGVRLGTEMADRARFWGRVGGIFHTDEMPAYGITTEEIGALMHTLEAGPDDAAVFVADASEKASDALKAVMKRAKEAVKGVPPETRAARPDGTTRYLRPRPGAARMYPETDVPVISVSPGVLDDLRLGLPELPDLKKRRLMTAYGLNEKLVRQIMDSEFDQLFERAADRSKASPTMIAVILTEMLKALKRDGVEVENVSEHQLMELFELLGDGGIAKEAVPDVITWLGKHQGASVSKAVEALGFRMLSEDELEKIVDELVEDNRRLLVERGEKAFGVLMGLVMEEVRGRVRAESVAGIVKRKLAVLAG